MGTEKEFDEILDEFDKTMRFLSSTNEKISAKEVTEIIVRTIEAFFRHVKMDNPALVRLCENSEMSLTTSMIFSVCQLTSRGEEVKDFLRRQMSDGKPN